MSDECFSIPVEDAGRSQDASIFGKAFCGDSNLPNLHETVCRACVVFILGCSILFRQMSNEVIRSVSYDGFMKTKLFNVRRRPSVRGTCNFSSLPKHHVCLSGYDLSALESSSIYPPSSLNLSHVADAGDPVSECITRQFYAGSRSQSSKNSHIQLVRFTFR